MTDNPSLGDLRSEFESYLSPEKEGEGGAMSSPQQQEVELPDWAKSLGAFRQLDAAGHQCG